MPDLDFRVDGAECLAFAAVPTLVFKLGVVNHGDEAVRSLTLQTQVRIAATQRLYSPDEQAHLLDVFGQPSRWAQTVGSLLWTTTTLLVPGFVGETQVDLPLACTYDFEVVSAKYFHALHDGEVPLDFLFSGTVFYQGAGEGEGGGGGQRGLQAMQVSWEKEAHFRLPIGVWKETMDRYFPQTAWLRIPQDTFDRLSRFRARQALPTWEATLERLLQQSEAQDQEGAWTR